jgi:hypothetical protein
VKLVVLISKKLNFEKYNFYKKKFKMYRILLIVAILFIQLNAVAQGNISFKKDLHDFGTVFEGDEASYEFEFTNTGTAPVIISNVQASCGCTTPSYTKDPVLPGKTGKIKAAYNTVGRIGAFNKTITITSNAENGSVVLTIKGTVLEKPKTNLQSNQAGNTLALGKVKQGKAITKTVQLTNKSQKAVKITSVESSCNCIKVTKFPKEIAAGGTGNIDVVYNPVKAGASNEVITFLTDEQDGKLEIKLNAEVESSSSSMLKQSDKKVPFN